MLCCGWPAGALVDGYVGRESDGAVFPANSRARESRDSIAVSCSRSLMCCCNSKRCSTAFRPQDSFSTPHVAARHSSPTPAAPSHNSIVLSEANAIDKLVARFITDAPEGTVKESLYSVFLRGVVHALGQRRTGNEQHLFMKFACCSFAQIRTHQTNLAQRAMGFSLSRSSGNDRLESERCSAMAGR